MPVLCSIFLLYLLLWGGGYAVYMSCNRGLAPNARLQQFLRYMVGALVAVLPLAVMWCSPWQPALLLSLGVSASWMVSYPLLYHLTNRKVSPDYDNQIDISFGIYLFGWLSSLFLLLPVAGYGWGVLLFLLFMPMVVLWVYYITCHVVLDESGMKMLQETDYNEVIEFLHSYSAWRILTTALAVLLLAAGCIYTAGSFRPVFAEPAWWQQVIVGGLLVFSTIYMWKPSHGLFVRCGLSRLYQVVKEYVENNSHYISNREQRMTSLDVETPRPLNTPHTIIMVIGESASRDYMSAFVTLNEDTTPWMRCLSEDKAHCVLFPHAYSCDIQTVPTLEKVLTEYNQYDGGQFYTSCSVVDIAEKAGYHIHWYSNQGHLGAADTPITLVANSAHVAKWTEQVLNKTQYDESLIDFLSEVDPKEKNFVVLHLMGSHFNYENRFTEETRQWGEPGNHDRILNYKNSLYYTDTVLRHVFEYGREHLNLQGMVYFSDHGDIPDRHRMPNFSGFLDTRIPLMVWLGKEYVALRPDRLAALQNNSLRYWTNDLLYELMCGIFDIKSNHYREDNSLASDQYRFTLEQLTAMNGRFNISIDANDTRINT